MAYDFEGLTKFLVGERYWECNQLNQYQFEVYTQPQVTMSGARRRQVRFQVKAVESGQILEIMMTEGYEHYGPRIYDNPAYMDPKGFENNKTYA